MSCDSNNNRTFTICAAMVAALFLVCVTYYETKTATQRVMHGGQMQDARIAIRKLSNEISEAEVIPQAERDKLAESLSVLADSATEKTSSSAENSVDTKAK